MDVLPVVKLEPVSCRGDSKLRKAIGNNRGVPDLMTETMSISHFQFWSSYKAKEADTTEGKSQNDTLIEV